jgi:hypothetical protein
MILHKRDVEPGPVERDNEVGTAEVVSGLGEGKIIVEVRARLALIPDAEDADSAFTTDSLPITAKVFGATTNLQIEVKGVRL